MEYWQGGRLLVRPFAPSRLIDLIDKSPCKRLFGIHEVIAIECSRHHIDRLTTMVRVKADQPLPRPQYVRCVPLNIRCLPFEAARWLM